MIPSREEGPQRFLIPARAHRVEEVIRRSRFITSAAHAPDSRSAHAFVDGIRGEFPDATHNCWAFVAGPPGSTANVGMSDDNEPHGTAGRPMLNALLHSGVGEIVAVTTRYFGGTKLGTGGLGRAYAGGVKLVLESLPTREKVTRVPVKMVVDYDAVDGLKRLLEEMESLVSEEEFGARVQLLAAVPEEFVDPLRDGLAEITRGRAVFQVLEKADP